jgi:serine/threonine protein kinase
VDGTVVAIKIMMKSNALMDDGKPREFVFLKQINSPYHVPFIDWFEDEINVYLVMEYYPDGTLQEYLDRVKEQGQVIPERVCFMSLRIREFLLSWFYNRRYGSGSAIWLTPSTMHIKRT